MDPEDGCGGSAWGAWLELRTALVGRGPYRAGNLMTGKSFCSQFHCGFPPRSAGGAGFASCGGAGREAGLAVGGVTGLAAGLGAASVRGWLLGWLGPDPSRSVGPERALWLLAACYVISTGSRLRPPCVQKLQASPPEKMLASREDANLQIWSAQVPSGPLEMQISRSQMLSFSRTLQFKWCPR